MMMLMLTLSTMVVGVGIIRVDLDYEVVVGREKGQMGRAGIWMAT
jgi:hypothetical protein